VCVEDGFFLLFFGSPEGNKGGKRTVSEIRLDPVLFIASMPTSIISIGVWSSVFFFDCFWVRPKGIKETEELVDGARLDPFSFIASMLPKSIISSSV